MIPLDVSSISSIGNWSNLPKFVDIQNFQATISDEKFPGVILPRVTKDGTLIWYAGASSAHNWRKLRPILLAYAGPTVTDFMGLKSQLDPSDEFEAHLRNVANGQFARLKAPKGDAKFAAKALSRLVTSVQRAPSSIKVPLKSTGALLIELDMHLAAGDRTRAEMCLTILDRDWRLDEVNLRFVEVRIAAAFRDWSRLIKESWFENICYISKPAYISHALLEAVWYTRLAPFEDDIEMLRANYDSDTRSLCKELLEKAEFIGGVAVQSIAELEKPEAQIVEEVEQSNSMVEQPNGKTTGLEHCVNLLSEGRIEDLVDAFRQASRSRPVATLENDEIELIAERLQEFALEDQYSPTLQKIAPEFARWLGDDPEFPRVQLRSLYETALTIFTILDDKGDAARNALLDIFDALLELQPSATQYRQHIQDVTAFVAGEAGTSTVYWLIDLADRLTLHPATDGDERQRLLNVILSSLEPIGQLLTRPQRSAYARVAAVANWPPLAESVEDETATTKIHILKDKVVAIYTLTERAGIQASSIIEEAFPGAKVEINSDHVCTPKLKSLAKGADLFVVVTGSAKHAATNCIQQNRPSAAPLSYAAGRGATSIVRAVEDSVCNQW